MFSCLGDGVRDPHQQPGACVVPQRTRLHTGPLRSHPQSGCPSPLRPVGVQTFIITAAHVVDKQNASLRALGAQTSDRTMFECVVAHSWRQSFGANGNPPPAEDIAVLRCDHATTGERLEDKLRAHALTPAARGARLWQPLAFAGYISPSALDSSLRSTIDFIYNDITTESVEATFIVRRTQASASSIGNLDASTGMMDIGAQSSFAAGFAVTEHALPAGTSGGPVVGKEGEVYGVVHGRGYGGVYTTLQLVRQFVEAGELTEPARPKSQVLLAAPPA